MGLHVHWAGLSGTGILAAEGVRWHRRCRRMERENVEELTVWQEFVLAGARPGPRQASLTVGVLSCLAACGTWKKPPARSEHLRIEGLRMQGRSHQIQTLAAWDCPPSSPWSCVQSLSSLACFSRRDMKLADNYPTDWYGDTISAIKPP